MMNTRWFARALGVAWLLALGACGDTALLRVSDGMGPQPVLPAPVATLIPTVNVAPGVGWPAGAAPVGAPGTRVQAFARDLDHPRWLLVLPNGDVLVAETNRPPRPPRGFDVRRWLAGLFMQRAGAGTPSANRITLLRDTQGTGVADQRFVLLDGLSSPFGMALVGDELMVANADAVLAFGFKVGDTRISGPGRLVARLPGGPINHHWTKNLLASPDGRTLYASVGSNSNIAEGGLAQEDGRAAIWQIDVATGQSRLFATGLRNPVGMAWVPGSPLLWTVVNERDELGSDLVPDYLTSVRDGGFYGWPWRYFGTHTDARVTEPAPAGLLDRTLVPDYALGPHTASLGLASSVGHRLPPPFADGVFVGQHGSWNRRPHSGYQVVFVPFAAGRPTGLPVPVLTGFLSPDGQAWGRPVGVAVDRQGALLVADDVGNAVWRVSAAAAPR